MGAGGGGDVAGEIVPGEPAEEGKGGGLLGVYGKTGVLGGLDVNVEGLEAGAEVLEQGGVAGAAAGDEEVGGLGERGALTEVRPDEAAIGVEDGFGGEGCGCGDDVALARVFGFAAGEEEVGEVGAELFSAAAFGWLLGEVGVLEKFVEDGLEDLAAAGGGAAAVVGATGEALHGGVDDHVGWTGVEGEDGGVVAGCGEGR